MSDRRAGWFLVVVSAAIGAVVTFISSVAVRVGPLRPTADTWLDGALSVLPSSSFAIIMVVVVDAVAFAISKDAWVRVTAIFVAVGTIFGVLAVAGVVAATTDPAVVESHGPRSWDCTEPDLQSPAAFQEAVDELVHPQTVEALSADEDACAGLLVGVPVVSAIADYEPQLRTMGWTIEIADDSQLRAQRDGLTFVLSACREKMTLVEIRLSTTPETPWCSP